MSESKHVYNNLIWRFLEKCGSQGVTFIVSIVLARLLDPATYGTMAILTVIVTFLQVFVDGGFANALIQKKEVDDIDFSSVFYFNLILCSVIYIVLYVSSPYVATFYNMVTLTELIRVAGLLLFISAFKNVQQAFVSRHLMFKKFFFSTLGGTIGAAIIGVLLALNGAGIWALVVQLLFNNFVDTVVLWMTVKWRPKMVFSFTRLSILFSFGWKLLTTNLLNTLYIEIRQLIIGKFYLSENLAYYNRGNQLPYYIVANVNSSIDSVLFPVMSKQQDNLDKILHMTRKSIRVSGFVIWPLMIGLSATANNLVSVLLTDKWLGAVPYIYIFSLTYGLYPITTANLNAIKALGKSDIILKLEFMKKLISVIIILISVKFGVLWIAASSLITSVFSQYVNARPNKQLLNYGILEQIVDILPVIVLSLVMGGVVYLIGMLHMNKVFLLLIQTVCGGSFYLFVAKLLNFEGYTEIRNLFMRFNRR